MIFDEIFLDDYIITKLYGESITSILLSKIRLLCFSCDEVLKNSSNIIFMKGCRCQFCYNCLEKKIIKYTQGHIVLNRLEKNNYPKIKCPCNDIFNIDEALCHYNSDLKDLKAEALQRLTKYSQTMCLRCIKSLINDGPKAINHEYVCLPVLEQKANPTDNEISFSPHLLCLDCRSYLREWENLNSDDLIMKTKQIPCKICDTTHMIEIEVWKKVMKVNSCSCIVF